MITIWDNLEVINKTVDKYIKKYGLVWDEHIQKLFVKALKRRNCFDEAYYVSDYLEVSGYLCYNLGKLYDEDYFYYADIIITDKFDNILKKENESIIECKKEDTILRIEKLTVDKIIKLTDGLFEAVDYISNKCRHNYYYIVLSNGLIIHINPYHWLETDIKVNEEYMFVYEFEADALDSFDKITFRNIYDTNRDLDLWDLSNLIEDKLHLSKEVDKMELVKVNDYLEPYELKMVENGSVDLEELCPRRYEIISLQGELYFRRCY